MDLSILLAIVIPIAIGAGGVIKLIYNLGKKLGKMEESIKTMAKEYNEYSNKTSEVNSQFGEIRERLAHIEGKLGISDD